MKYPVLTKTTCAELSAQLVAGHRPAIDPHVEWLGTGEEIDLAPVDAAALRIVDRAREWTDKDRDRFEGRAGVDLLEALAEVPTEVLDDRGFWRYLSLRYFWEFIAWREEGPFSKGNHLKYVDAATNTEAVLPRMYLRAQAVGGRDYGDLASGIPMGADFWRSHVVRVRTGSAPPVTRALAMMQAGDRLPTNPLRQAARRLNRTWTNVVLRLYDDDEATRLVDTIWDHGVDD